MDDPTQDTDDVTTEPLAPEGTVPPPEPEATAKPAAKKVARRAATPAPERLSQVNREPELLEEPEPPLPPDTGDLDSAYSLWLIRTNPTQARSQYAGREHRLTAEARTLLA